MIEVTLYRSYTFQEVEEEAAKIVETLKNDPEALGKQISVSASVVAGPSPDVDPFAASGFTLSLNRAILVQCVREENPAKSDKETNKLIDQYVRDSTFRKDRFDAQIFQD